MGKMVLVTQAGDLRCSRQTRPAACLLIPGPVSTVKRFCSQLPPSSPSVPVQERFCWGVGGVWLGSMVGVHCACVCALVGMSESYEFSMPALPWAPREFPPCGGFCTFIES